MKKLLAAAVCACMFSGTAANAAVVNNDGRVSVTYDNISETPRDMIVYIFKPKTDLADGNIDAEDMQNLFRMEQRNSTTGFEDSFVMDSGDDEGIYLVVRGGYDNSKLSDRCEKFVYLKPETETKITGELKSAADAESLKAVFEKYNGFAWSLDTSRAAYSENRGEFYKEVYGDFGGSFKITADAEVVFDKVCTIFEMNALKGEELIAAIDKLGIGGGFYKNNSAATAAVYERYTQKGGTIEELKKSLAEAEAVTAVNTSDSGDVINTIKEYNDIFGADFQTDFLRVSSAQMAKALYNKNFTYASEVKAAFDARLKALLADTSGTGGSGGSGGGGKGGSTGSGSIGAAPGNSVQEIISQIGEKTIFADMDDAAWAKEYIEGVYRRQIMIGSDGYFRPNENVTRAELAKIIVLAKELDMTAAEINFSDVKSGDWYYEFIQTAVSNNIAEGMGDGSFGAEESVSRQDAAVMLHRAFGGDKGAALEFADSGSIADYAYDAVCSLCGQNVISGFPDNTFRPEMPLTRAQTAKIIYELIR